MTTAAAWPSAEEIARVIVAAALEEGDDPVQVAEGEFAPRSRIYAFLALAHQFPRIPRSAIAAKVGAKSPNLPACARAAVLYRAGLKWFDIDKLSRVRAAAGWAPITAAEAETATRVIPIDDEEEEPPEPDAPIDLPRLPIRAAVPAVAVEATVTAPAEAPAIISPASNEVEKSDVGAEVAETPAQPEPKAEAICQPETAPTPPRISAAARAVAAFQRVRTERRPAPAPTSLPAALAPKALASPPLFAATGGMDLHYRPDPPASMRGVRILTAALMGDPEPGRSALAQRRAGRAKS